MFTNYLNLVNTQLIDIIMPFTNVDQLKILGQRLCLNNCALYNRYVYQLLIITIYYIYIYKY